MKTVLILALMAASVSAAGPIPMVILRPGGESTYATCTPETCMQPEPKKTSYVFPVFIAVGSLCIAGIYAISRSLAGNRRLVSR